MNLSNRTVGRGVALDASIQILTRCSCGHTVLLIITRPPSWLRDVGPSARFPSHEPCTSYRSPPCTRCSMCTGPIHAAPCSATCLVLQLAVRLLRSANYNQPFPGVPTHPRTYRVSTWTTSIRSLLCRISTVSYAVCVAHRMRHAWLEPFTSAEPLPYRTCSPSQWPSSPRST